MESTFTSNMEPIEQYLNYPEYARRRTVPGKRARDIIDRGRSDGEPCTKCIAFNNDCYRYGKFGKCAFCTARGDTEPECHLKGEPEVLPVRKRRKLEQMEAGSTTAPTDTPLSASRSVREQAPSPNVEFMEGITSRLEPRLAELALKSTDDATLERITALENQVSKLEEGFIELLVKLDELKSVDLKIGGRTPSADDRLTVNNLSLSIINCCPTVHKLDGDKFVVRAVEHTDTQDVRSENELVEYTESDNKEWLDGEEPLKHTREHPGGWRPINCICALPYTLEDNSVMQRDENMSE